MFTQKKHNDFSLSSGGVRTRHAYSFGHEQNSDLIILRVSIYTNMSRHFRRVSPTSKRPDEAIRAVRVPSPNRAIANQRPLFSRVTARGAGVSTG